MQFVAKLMEADLSDVQKGTRAKAYWPAISFAALPELVLRCWAVLMALASTIAVALVAVPSFVCYGAAKLLAKVRPLRDAYQFLSGTYDRLLERLGQKVLRDSRDTPALRLMVSLSLTTLPIFVVQLVLGKPYLLLAVAFYLSLYGLKFERFVRMFSAKHLEAHRRQGYFSEKYDGVFGRYVEFFLGYLYGNLPELDRTVHVGLHHRENGGLNDTVTSSRYDRKITLAFVCFLSAHNWTV